MTKRTALWLMVILTTVLGVAIAVAVRFNPSPNANFKDAAAALAFITGAAVAIERVIEALWTFIGGVWGSYWPLNTIKRQVDALVDDLDTSLKPFHEKAQAEIARLATANQWTQAQVDAAKGEIDQLRKRFDELKGLAADNQRIQLLTAAASQNVSYIQEKYSAIVPDLQAAGRIANTAIDGLQNFLATFKDNPARRLISLYVGIILGVIVASSFGLDILLAVLDTKVARFPVAEIILTGIVIGLGSSPTHEVIRSIQEYKKTQKGNNIGTPDLPSQP